MLKLYLYHLNEALERTIESYTDSPLSRAPISRALERRDIGTAMELLVLINERQKSVSILHLVCWCTYFHDASFRSISSRCACCSASSPQ